MNVSFDLPFRINGLFGTCPKTGVSFAYRESEMSGIKSLEIALIAVMVLMMSAGQVLFKIVALRANEQHTYFSASVLSLLFVALVVYGAATLVWIRVLQTAPLSLAYAFVGLSFIVVPVLSMIFFREALSLRFMIGAVVIVIGIVIATGR